MERRARVRLGIRLIRLVSIIEDILDRPCCRMLLAIGGLMCGSGSSGGILGVL
jgi:hypothetical protein